MLHNRPRLQPTLTSLDKLLERAAIAAFVAMWTAFAFCYTYLPPVVPTHFGASGEVDGYGSKQMLVALPFLGSVLYLGLKKLNKYPYLFNYMVEITPANAAQQYLIATRLVRYINLAILLVFGAVVVLTFFIASARINGLGSWVLPLLLAIFLVPTIVALTQSRKVNKQPG